MFLYVDFVISGMLYDLQITRLLIHNEDSYRHGQKVAPSTLRTGRSIRTKSSNCGPTLIRRFGARSVLGGNRKF